MNPNKTRHREGCILGKHDIEWSVTLKSYLNARAEAGTPRGIEFARRLEAMPAADAADEIMEMFALCADEDLADEIACDLQFHRSVGALIAAEIVKRRRLRYLSAEKKASTLPNPESRHSRL
jgi:hypothetical protein